MDSIANAYAAMTAAPVLVPNAAARTKGHVSLTPVDTFQGVWSPPPRREPL